jgi:hypothetical protein
MRFLEPSYLLLLPIALLGVWWSGRRLLGMSRGRKRLALALRMVVFALLIFALAAPQAVRPNRGTCTIFVLDASDSISDAGRQAAKRYLQEAIKTRGEDDLVGLVVFGRDAVVDFLPAELRELPTIYSKPAADGTNIAAALRLASAMFPDGKNRRIVLLSDGNETEGNAQDAALVAATENIEIDVVPLETARHEAEVLVLETQAPSEVKIGEPFNLRVVIESRKAAEGMLVIDRDGEPIKRVPVQLAPGKNAVVVPIRTDREGFHRYRVSLEASPTATRAITWDAFSCGCGASRACCWRKAARPTRPARWSVRFGRTTWRSRASRLPPSPPAPKTCRTTTPSCCTISPRPPSRRR